VRGEGPGGGGKVGFPHVALEDNESRGGFPSMKGFSSHDGVGDNNCTCEGDEGWVQV
jgi:hypothetical protein